MSISNNRKTEIPCVDTKKWPTFCYGLQVSKSILAEFGNSTKVIDEKNSQQLANEVTKSKQHLSMRTLTREEVINIEKLLPSSDII